MLRFLRGVKFFVSFLVDFSLNFGVFFPVFCFVTNQVLIRVGFFMT